MRSRRTCSLVECFLLVIGVGAAHAETITRVRVRIDELPKSDEPRSIAPSTAVLPNGAKHRGRVPSSWKTEGEYEGAASYCVEDRRAEISPIRNGKAFAQKLFESDGEAFLDSASLEVEDGRVEVKDASRTPVARVSDGIWAFRRKDRVVVVTATDWGENSHAVYYGCRLRQVEAAAPSGSLLIESSASIADRVMRVTIGDARRRATPTWVGTEARIVGSVSRSSADPAPMLSLVVRTGS